MNLKQLLGICEHKWKNIERSQMELVGKRSGHIKEWQRLIMQCEKCGIFKKIIL